MGMMIGTNRTVKENLVRSFEYLRIEERNGAIYYVAKPSSALNETSFKLIFLKNDIAVFENKNHDFPKRITYKKAGINGLVAEVADDTRGGGFLFERETCA